LRDSYAATIMPVAAMPDSYPDCRWLPIQIAALQMRLIESVGFSTMNLNAPVSIG
jgi:hypothetical protein